MGILLPSCKHLKVAVSRDKDHRSAASCRVSHRGIFVYYRDTVRQTSLLSDGVVGHGLAANRISLCNLVYIQAVFCPVLLCKNKHKCKITACRVA